MPNAVAREPLNLTPTFMRFALEAWRRGYRIGWAAHQTAQALGCDVALVYGRAKTPHNIGWQEGGFLYAPRWFAKFFRPVSDALIDGKDDATVLRIWRETDRKTEAGASAYQETGGHYTHRITEKATRTIRARELDKRHDWNTVK